MKLQTIDFADVAMLIRAMENEPDGSPHSGVKSWRREVSGARVCVAFGMPDCWALGGDGWRLTFRLNADYDLDDEGFRRGIPNAVKLFHAWAYIIEPMLVGSYTHFSTHVGIFEKALGRRHLEQSALIEWLVRP